MSRRRTRGLRLGGVDPTCHVCVLVAPVADVGPDRHHNTRARRDARIVAYEGAGAGVGGLIVLLDSRRYSDFELHKGRKLWLRLNSDLMASIAGGPCLGCSI